MVKAEEEEKQKQREKEIQKQKNEEYIRYLYTRLPEEPKEGKMTKLSFRLANGDRVVRSFSEHDTLDVSLDESFNIKFTYFCCRHFIDL